GIRDFHVTGVQTCALPILEAGALQRLRALALQRGDVTAGAQAFGRGLQRGVDAGRKFTLLGREVLVTRAFREPVILAHRGRANRSEERRVGKESTTNVPVS